MWSYTIKITQFKKDINTQYRHFDLRGFNSLLINYRINHAFFIKQNRGETSIT